MSPGKYPENVGAVTARVVYQPLPVFEIVPCVLWDADIGAYPPAPLPFPSISLPPYPSPISFPLTLISRNCLS